MRILFGVAHVLANLCGVLFVLFVSFYRRRASKSASDAGSTPDVDVAYADVPVERTQL